MPVIVITLNEISH